MRGDYGASLWGYKIFVTPDVPKMQLSPSCPVSDDYRIDTNKWMIDYFGTVNGLKDDEVITFEWPDRAMYMNPRMFAKVRKAIVEQGYDNVRIPTALVP